MSGLLDKLNVWLTGDSTPAQPEVGSMYDRNDVDIRITGRATICYGLFVVQCGYRKKCSWWKLRKRPYINAYIVEGYPDFIVANSHTGAVQQALLKRDGVSYVFVSHPKE